MMPPRFEVIADAGGYLVVDNHGEHVKFSSSFGQPIKHTIRLPASQKYASREDAQLVADWMDERAQGYPTPSTYDLLKNAVIRWENGGWVWSDAE